MPSKRKKPIEKQYTIHAEAIFVVSGSSLKDAKKNLEDQLQGLNTTDYKIGEGQALLPQIPPDQYEKEGEE